MREAKPLLGGAAAEQQRAHRCSLPDAGGAHGRRYIGHGVVDGEAGGDATARAVDVELNRFLRGVGFEEQELGHDGGGDGLVDSAVEADDALLRGYGLVGWNKSRGKDMYHQ